MFGPEQREVAEAIRTAQTAAFLTEDNRMLEAVGEQMNGADLWLLRAAILAGDVAAVRVRREIERIRRANPAAATTADVPAGVALAH